MITVKQAANLLNVTHQAIRVAIKKGSIKSQRDGYRILMEEKALYDYANSRYSRDDLYKEGELSPLMAAQLLKVPVQRIYYLMRKKQIPFVCKRVRTMMILKKDIENLKISTKTKRRL